MRSLRVGCTAVTGVTVLAGVLAYTSLAAAQPRCRDISATIRDKVVTEGCPPLTEACVIGTVEGRHGFTGTTVFVLGSRGEAPPTAPDQRPVSGTITYTFRDRSTLTALETSIGNVNQETGAGHAGGTQQFTGGTGRYGDSTGFAYLAQHFEVDHFVTSVQGEVCRAQR
ncbi:hypothetical protein [Microlunatus sp. Gsoil 973]|uniref:hypothetical protein n=1 Tax=Microlunatus sp. Gsoil 973 TaxID=2672569 RepID=UPI0012B49AF1|nr:hypothetical protein [Microlunatus sp. Gsoil 973]QGN34349.1 hypothetical protein GJV80_17690 [Microlunatus sp. Gsoil 973]